MLLMQTNTAVKRTATLNMMEKEGVTWKDQKRSSAVAAQIYKEVGWGQAPSVPGIKQQWMALIPHGTLCLWSPRDHCGKCPPMST